MLRCLTLAAFALAIGAAPATAGTPATAGALAGGAEWPESATKALLEYEFTTLDGERLTVSDLHGEVVIVNFWASWCAPCRRELPRLQELDGHMRDLGGRVVAVSVDEKRRKVEEFVDREGLSLLVVHDGPDGVAKDIELPSLPFTLVVSRTGEVVYASDRSDDETLRALDQLVTRALTDTDPDVQIAERDAERHPIPRRPRRDQEAG